MFNFYLSSTGIFTVSSVVYLTGSINTIITQGITFDNVVNVIGNSLYVIGYIFYFISDYKTYNKDKLLFVSSYSIFNH